MDDLLVKAGNWFLDQGVLGVCLGVSIAFNVKMVKELVSVVKENTAAFSRLEKVIEGKNV